MLKAYITNLGKYNEGELVGEYLAFPATTEEVQALLARIGVDGKRYEELFITDYESDIAGLTENMKASTNSIIWLPCWKNWMTGASCPSLKRRWSWAITAEVCRSLSI